MRLHLNNDAWKDADHENLQESAELLRTNSTQNLFAGYFYDTNQQNNPSEAATTK